MQRLIRCCAVALTLIAVLCGQRGAAASGGTSIVNQASVTYSDAASHHYSTSSNAVIATVVELSAIVVSPKEASANPSTESVGIGAPTTRTYSITNTSNITDAYQIDKLTAGNQQIVALAWLTANGPIATSVNGTLSPNVAPGSSISVQATIATAGLTIGQSVPVLLDAHTTVTGTATGLAYDHGQQWIIGAAGASLTGPSGANSQVTKTVNQVAMVQSQPGGTVLFSIAAMNSGGAAATNVIVSDDVPGGLAVNLSTALIDGQPAGGAASLNGQTISFHVSSLAPGAQLAVSFNAELPPGSVLGESFVNIATISADGIPAVPTTPASVLAGTANIVFNGFAGASQPIAGAIVSLLDGSGNPVTLSTGAGPASLATRSAASLVTASGNSQNPYTTGASGTYGFALSPASIPSAGGSYFLTISAPGYLNRRIQLNLMPTSQNYFYNVTQTSLDAQPLAVAGGFTLTKQNVAISNVSGLFGNIPLFAARTIVVTKTVNKQAAQAGDSLIYTVVFSDQAPMPIGFTTILDTLPAGLVYIPGSSHFDGTPIEPVIQGRNLSWTLADLQPGDQHTITYGATIFGSIPEGTSLTNTVGVTGSIPATHVATGGSSSVTVLVVQSALSTRRVLTGRVFIDLKKTGYFVKGDIPLPDVRVVMENGSYALTDSNGEFSFPSIRPGEHVLRLDPLTLPKSVSIDAHGRLNSPHSLQRLIHGILDDSSMIDIQFALRPAP